MQQISLPVVRGPEEVGKPMIIRLDGSRGTSRIKEELHV
jgi:hypothetical protein